MTRKIKDKDCTQSMKKEFNGVSLTTGFFDGRGDWAGETLSIVPETHGVSVWHEVSSMGIENESYSTQIGDIAGPWDWRKLAEWLRAHKGIWPSGCEVSVDEVEVEGIEPYIAEALLLCMKSDQPTLDSEHLDYLIQLQDPDIEYLWKAHRSLLCDNFIHDFENIAGWLQQFEGKDLKVISSLLGKTKLPPPKLFFKLIDDNIDFLDELAKIDTMVDSHLHQDPDPTKAELLRAFLSKRLKEDGGLPGGCAEIDQVGSVDFDRLLGKVEGFIRSFGDSLLDRTAMEKCREYPAPIPGPCLSHLIRSWVAIPDKPRNSKDFSLALREEAAYLLWMLENATPAFFREFSTLYWSDYERLHEWMKQIDSENEGKKFGPGMGGAWGYSRFAAKRDAWSKLVEVVSSI